MGRKASLGFRYLSLDDEMLAPTERDIVHSVEREKTSQHEKEKARKLRWWHRNKDYYNAHRRTVASSISRRYKAAKSRAKRRGWGWEFSQLEWERAWTDAGWVLVPGSQTAQNPEGVSVPAFALRGSHAYNNTCMQRIDPNRPWSISNYKIMFRGEELKPGSKWYRDPPHTSGT